MSILYDNMGPCEEECPQDPNIYYRTEKGLVLLHLGIIGVHGVGSKPAPIFCTPEMV